MYKIRRFLVVTYVWILLGPLGLIGLGAALNQIATISNHDTMPVLVNEAALAKAGGADTVSGKRMMGPDHSVMDENSRLKFLCDVFDFGKETDSIGDILIDFGLWLWAFCPYIWGSIVCLKLVYMEGL